ncbi:MAG: twin-arginine translocase subunit TatC [Clostridium sp.]
MGSKNKKQSVMDHLSELRKRLMIIAVVTLLSTLLCYQFVDKIVQLILNLNQGVNLVYIAPAELFIVYIKLAITFGIVLSSPITLTQIWIFISKGLFKKEKIYIVISLIFGIVFFIGGVLFCYSVVLPITLSFFVNITVPGIEAMISVDSFVSFISTMLLCFGVVFEMPIVIFLLSLIGIVKPETLLKNQKIFILIIFVVSAFITPPDLVSQTFLAIPMVLLFELSIGISFLVKKKKNKKSQKATE